MTGPRTLLLTGAAGGIGRAVARRFVDAGSHVVLVDRDAATLASVAASLGTDRVTVVLAEAADPGAADRVVAAAVGATGGIDDLVLAAGIYPEAAVADTTDEGWDACVRTNLTHPFQVCRAAVPHLRPGASIVAITSIAGQRGSRNHAAYAATKAGLLGFLRSLALELAPQARVNAVAPGTISTPMTTANRERFHDGLLAATPLARFGEPDEVAGVIQFLCSPAAGFVTGEEISINGGMHMA